MPAYRCNYCEVRWPNGDVYKECPCCREPTVYLPQNGPSIDPPSAAIERARFNFGWWLWDTGQL